MCPPNKLANLLVTPASWTGLSSLSQKCPLVSPAMVDISLCLFPVLHILSWFIKESIKPSCSLGELKLCHYHATFFTPSHSQPSNLCATEHLRCHPAFWPASPSDPCFCHWLPADLLDFLYIFAKQSKVEICFYTSHLLLVVPWSLPARLITSPVSFCLPCLITPNFPSLPSLNVSWWGSLNSLCPQCPVERCAAGILTMDQHSQQNREVLLFLVSQGLDHSGLTGISRMNIWPLYLRNCCSSEILI